MFSSFLSAPVFLKLVLILSGVIFKPTVYHPLCGVLVGLFSEDLRWCFLLSKRVLLMRLSFCRIFSRHVFNNSNCLALGWLLLDFLLTCSPINCVCQTNWDRKWMIQLMFFVVNQPNSVGRHRLSPEHVQISTPQTWPHPNTMRTSGARALGGMFCNARATHTAKLCPKNIGAKTQKCWDKKSCAGSAGAKKVYAGHASHTLAHCFQEMSACMIADI